MGTCGEYSDRSEWPVRAYKHENVAQFHVTKASDRAREIMKNAKDPYDITEENEFDPNMSSWGYGTTTYYVMEVELL
jgi:hypothetical protein